MWPLALIGFVVLVILAGALLLIVAFAWDGWRAYEPDSSLFEGCERGRDWER